MLFPARTKEFSHEGKISRGAQHRAPLGLLNHIKLEKKHQVKEKKLIIKISKNIWRKIAKKNLKPIAHQEYQTKDYDSE